MRPHGCGTNQGQGQGPRQSTYDTDKFSPVVAHLNVARFATGGSFIGGGCRVGILLQGGFVEGFLPVSRWTRMVAGGTRASGRTASLRLNRRRGNKSPPLACLLLSF